MNRLLPVFLLAFACLVPGCQAQDTSQTPASLPPIQVFFSPKGGCTEAKVRSIRPVYRISTKRPSGGKLQEPSTHRATAYLRLSLRISQSEILTTCPMPSERR